MSIRTKGDAEVLDLLKKGLPFTHFEKLRKSMTLTSVEMARAARVSLRNLYRRKHDGRMKPEKSERIFRIACVLDKAVDALGIEDSARKWFRSPISALAMKTPLNTPIWRWACVRSSTFSVGSNTGYFRDGRVSALQLMNRPHFWHEKTTPAETTRPETWPLPNSPSCLWPWRYLELCSFPSAGILSNQ
jgi:putative toxin-antitoxin system antitoxin component (TIGR02293 family)